MHQMHKNKTVGMVPSHFQTHHTKCKCQGARRVVFLLRFEKPLFQSKRTLAPWRIARKYCNIPGRSCYRSAIFSTCMEIFFGRLLILVQQACSNLENSINFRSILLFFLIPCDNQGKDLIKLQTLSCFRGNFNVISKYNIPRKLVTLSETNSPET